MTTKVIDTNVLVLANGQSTSVVESCVDSTKEYLAAVFDSGVIALDFEDEILKEYIDNVVVSRPYGLGAQFLIELLRVQYNPRRVRKVSIQKDVSGGYVEFPAVPELAAFDISDRKFAVLSILTRNPVVNAVDSDWIEFLGDLQRNGVSVVFLCGSVFKKWFVKCE